MFNFKAEGDEAYLPKTDNQSLGVFTFEELTLNEKSKINVEARLESNSVEPLPSAGFSAADKKDFLLGSLAFGSNYDFSKTLKLTSLLSYSERAPNYQELFADGAHVATFNHDLGDENLDKEKVVALDLSLRKAFTGSSFIFTIFGQRFQDYIALNPTGSNNDRGTIDTDDEVPQYYYEATSAFIYGFSSLELRQAQQAFG